MKHRIRYREKNSVLYDRTLISHKENPMRYKSAVVTLLTLLGAAGLFKLYTSKKS